MENPFREAFYMYAKTRRGLSTVNYEMVVGMLKRADLFCPPTFNESSFQRDFRKAYGRAEDKENDYQAFQDICKKVIAPSIAQAKSITPDEAEKLIQDALIKKQPKSISDKVIKSF